MENPRVGRAPHQLLRGSLIRGFRLVHQRVRGGRPTVTGSG